ncbi:MULTISPECIES: flagellar hook protein FlgE [Chromobacterium]|uniref:Flagellar hook protein FlgE n=2 Tax=Chromobacterium TaxID=535 RepID=A0ABS3GT14_9NEIS|nr:MULTISPECIES: flagellar hook-basal body complex protein [Chromobacterium]AXT47126.1 flagellar hook-basal body complex protein [Chromobacterium rhizoryzae]MBK0417062.1 flagellar hook-basal body complex protein [Chromobacterium haemolyticum]MBO0418188.1 flagellar hook-basal body complex protein [Chromobacterium haemolyticum]MBO0501419.1 flagellar hook-basal body complex protein [Chromobacterium haemolyticum]MDH0343805.1 flagellar hook-basal body complex protein [Chromobacterium haemolyticum]
MSFDIALSGINAVNNQLGNISNNIANTGTYGFKSSRTSFSAAYAGAQPMGVEVVGHSQNMARNGNTVRTGRPLDAAIDGRGFFVSRDLNGGMAYSRVGIFTADKDGYLVDGFNRRVQGYGKADGNALGAFGDIKIPNGNIPAKASDKLQYVGNMSAGWSVQTMPFDKSQNTFNSSAVSTVYDSLGNKLNLTQYFCKTGPNTITVHYTLDGKDQPTTATLTFDTDGKLTSPTAPVALNLGTPPGASPLAVNLDYTGTTQFAGESSQTLNASNGYASGSMTGTSLNDNGDVVAAYSNGQKQVVGTLAIANFPNESALQATSQTSWVETAGSGTAVYSRPGAGLSGNLLAFTLEQSNVDMTSELVDLMTAQRNYQANTKVISTENQTIQALMQAV